MVLAWLISNEFRSKHRMHLAGYLAEEHFRKTLADGYNLLPQILSNNYPWSKCLCLLTICPSETWRWYKENRVPSVSFSSSGERETTVSYAKIRLLETKKEREQENINAFLKKCPFSSIQRCLPHTCVHTY